MGNRVGEFIPWTNHILCIMMELYPGILRCRLRNNVSCRHFYFYHIKSISWSIRGPDYKSIFSGCSPLTYFDLGFLLIPYGWHSNPPSIIRTNLNAILLMTKLSILMRAFIKFSIFFQTAKVCPRSFNKVCEWVLLWGAIMKKYKLFMNVVRIILIMSSFYICV